MVNAPHTAGKGGNLSVPEALLSTAARADLVNSGQDTRITFRDGSTIVLKGVTQIEAVFSAGGAAPK